MGGRKEEDSGGEIGSENRVFPSFKSGLESVEMIRQSGNLQSKSRINS